MEHGAVADVLDAASANLAGTYLELGRNSSEAMLFERPGLQVCVAALDHPICNFALAQDLSEDDAWQLAHLASEHSSFHAYVLPGHGAASTIHLLSKVGFQQIHQLSVLIRDGEDCGNESLRPFEETERRKTADFMTRQFFGRSSSVFRNSIAEATSASEGLSLLRFPEGRGTAASLMLSEHGGMLGIYNLCVAPEHRRRGIGSAMVRLALGRAYSKGLPATLQCDPSLAAWYRGLGFEEAGSVAVYGLCRFKEIDIMGLQES